MFFQEAVYTYVALIVLTNTEKFAVHFHLEMKPTLTDLQQEISDDITTDVATHNTHTHISIFIFSVAQKSLYTVFR
jgi:hypothetical protein